MELCLEVEQLPGARVERIWWKRGGLDLEGTRAAERLAEAESEERRGSEGRKRGVR